MNSKSELEQNFTVPITESLKAALLFGALDLNGHSDDFSKLEEKLLNLLSFSIAGFYASQ
jgi:hypothetical protein